MPEVSMNHQEQAFLKSFVKGNQPVDVVQSQTRIDTGKWLRTSPLWICIFKDQVVVLAIGRRKYIECVPLTEINETHYCHTTGELVLAPIRTLTHRRLAMSPGDSLRVFSALGIDASNLSNHS
jgi:hypothetical protein